MGQTLNMIKVGFIGLGTMGLPMAVNLQKRGFQLTVYDTMKERVDLAIKSGAVSATSPKEIARESDVVMLSLPKAEISEAVVLGKNGVLEGAHSGLTLIDLSTVPPDTVRKIEESVAKKDVEVLDAPVSGGRSGAEQATLTIMVGGKKDVYEKCLPIFEAIGRKIYHVGNLGSAETIKLMNSFVAISNLLIAKEALQIAETQGVDPKMMHKVIDVSTGQSWMWSNWISSVLARKSIGSTPEIMLKDMDYALRLAEKGGIDPEIGERVLHAIREWSKTTSTKSDVSVMFDFLKQKELGT
ncbi:MAG TPA: NAD(P)-dependent oxidoreductase [Candidatus Bathyarchaeia archaeon]|nr:NAD(P)-dependent oxidoreductase [Candidatus Bathyarchaeia archaeon]